MSVIRAVDVRTLHAQSSSVISSDDGKLVTTNTTMANLVCKEYVSVRRLPKDKAADKVITFITSHSQHYVAKRLSTGSALHSSCSQLFVAFREVLANWGIAEIRLRPIVMCGKQPNTISSFRPISLLSIAELVERLIHEHLAHLLESNHLLLHPASLVTGPRKSKWRQSPSSTTMASNREGRIYAQTSYSRTSPEATTESG